MATTVDNLQVNVSVQGTQQLNAANAQLLSVDQNVKQINNTVRSFNTRILSANIQDIAVQAELGVNGLRILGQQGSEVLAAFGARGAALGAALAVGVAVAKPVLNALGVEMRSLTELTKDSTKATEDFKTAQKENIPTIASIVFQYGEATSSAKRFFEVQEQLKKQVALNEQRKALEELADTFKKFSTESANQPRLSGPISSMYELGRDAYALFQRMNLGLTADQARKLGDELQGINKKSPEEARETLTRLAEEIARSTEYSDKAKKALAEMLLPLIENSLKAEEDLKAATKRASEFNAELMRMQSRSILPVGDAKRNFDQIAAIGLESQAKIQEFTLQANQKYKEDKVNREKEIAAYAAKVNAERINAEKDFAKAQQETFYAQQLSNEQNERSLVAQKQINQLRMEQIDSLNYENVLEEGRTKNIQQQVNANLAIEELRRRNLITEERADRLREQAASIRKQSDILTAQEAQRIRLENERTIRIQVEGLQLENAAKQKIFELEKATFSLSTLDQQARKQLLDIDIARDRAIQDLNNNSRLSESEKLDALIRINEEYAKSKDLVKEQLKYNQDMQKDFGKGAEQRVKELIESFSQFKVAGMEVDAVWNNMSSALDNFVETGKLNFGDFAASVIKDLLKIELKASAMAMFKAAGGGAGIMSGLGDLFGGIKGFLGLASGGPVSANTPYVVGEAGPELFLPNTSGSIVPNNRLGGQTVVNNHYITNQISAVDAKSVAQLFYENRQTLFGTVEQAKKELPFRQGAMV